MTAYWDQLLKPEGKCKKKGAYKRPDNISESATRRITKRLGGFSSRKLDGYLSLTLSVTINQLT
jgi:hypothetical protein